MSDDEKFTAAQWAAKQQAAQQPAQPQPAALDVQALAEQITARFLAAKEPVGAAVPLPVHASPPSMTIPLEREVSVLEMSPAQIHELMRKKGGDPSRPYDPRNRAARRSIRESTEQALRSRRVKLDSR